MPYLGNPAVDRFTSTKAASVYSGNGSTTAFTLEHSVGADEDILVSVDGVIQEPSVSLCSKQWYNINIYCCTFK